MKLLLSLLLVAGIGSDAISTSFGSIGKHNLPSSGEVIPEYPPEPLYRYDSQEDGNITTAFSTVSSWASSGTSSLALVQGTALQRGVHSGTGDAAQVDFDGSNDFVSATVSSILRSHIFAVVTPDAVASNGTGTSCQNNDAPVGWVTYGPRISFRNNAGTIYLVGSHYNGSAHKCVEISGITLGTKVLTEVKVDGSNISIAINGGAFTSTVSTTTALFSTSFMVGTNNAGSFYFNGKVHEVYVYNDAQTTDRDTIVNWLMWKWGI